MSADVDPLCPASHTSSADEQFRTMVESVKDYAIFLLDKDGRVKTWNVGAQLIKGYTPSEIIGRRIDVFYPPEARAEGLPNLLLHKAALEGRVEHEGWRVRKDGTRFWADVVITAVRDGNGQLTGYAKVTRDLTQKRLLAEERRQRRESLWRSEERFRMLVEGVEEYAIFMLDPNGVVATWNAGAERIKGYTAAEIIGKHFSVFRTEAEAKSGVCDRELALAAREGKLSQEGWRVRKDGTKFWASVVLRALRDGTGELVGFAKITRDLTQRQQLEDERLQRARAEEAVRLRDEFLLIASHELKTPLTSLQIDLHALRAETAEAERLRRRIERAARNVDRLNGLIDSLLNVSRLAHGKLVLKPVTMDLGESVAQVVDTMRGQAARAGCEVRISSLQPVVGVWDRLRIEQVVMNLLSNALKYGAGSAVEVFVGTVAGEAVVQVRDGGPGVPPADLDRIFERFERASSIRHFGGLGLGLYISREIVKAHGGSIAVTNHPGGGAELTVRLPMVVAIEASSDAVNA